MRIKNKLLNKVKRLLRRLGCPRWLHHFGSKTYEFKEHLQALLVQSFCRLSFRRVVKLLDLLGIRCPSKSALQYTSKKLSSAFWQQVLKVTSGDTYLAALDSTGLSRTNPSYHYLRRIDGKMPKIPIKLSAAFDTRKKKFRAANIRVLPAHDIRDAAYLIKESNPKIAVADKAYSAEALYRFAEEQNILFMAPMKKNVKRGHARRKMHKRFRTRTYNRRQLIESAFGSIKRKFGSNIRSKTVRTIRTEVYGKLACHNLFGIIQDS
ncbi:MAG: transposase [archaeon]